VDILLIHARQVGGDHNLAFCVIHVDRWSPYALGARDLARST
jgi:hypothetical protein